MNNTAILRAGLDAMYYSGASRMLRPLWQGTGAILMLHHVRPQRPAPDGFAPNAALEIDPGFLDRVIARVLELGYELLTFPQAIERIRSGVQHKRKFAVFTLDDGYRDNMVHAWPVFRKHNCPFTIFVAPAIAEGRCELWWKGLEAAIAAESEINATIDGVSIQATTVTDAQKTEVFERIYWPLRSMENHAQRHWIRAFCESAGIDLDAMCRAEAMTWSELKAIAADPLCTIGAHTINHFTMSRLTADQAVEEATASRDEIERRLGIRPALFAYPYGDESSAGPRDFALIRDAGFTAAVTTRKGVITTAHRDHLTALPRVSLNGHYQKLRYLDVLLGGSVFMAWNRFKAVNVN